MGDMIEFLRRVLGRPSDWHLVRPAVRLIRPGLRWLGPVAIVASCVFSWWAFTGAQGEDGSVALGLYVGAVAILLMAWSFVLALRLRVLERCFGGLDSMYRAHRWAGSISVAFMFWHVRVEPEVENGILGASRSVADGAADLAGTGEYLLYLLIGLSLLRWIPYRWWRWTHKLIGVPFAFACWHFFTAEKPYANDSPWGWWFGGLMLARLAAWIGRVGWRDAVARGTRYRITSADVEGTTTSIELEPAGRPIRYEPGQFAFVKVQAPGLREPHAFTIASAPTSRLRFVIRELGDWTARLRERELVGTDVIVEGPYGEFEPFGDDGQATVWIAGGVGITPFLAAIDSMSAAGGSMAAAGGSGSPPHLLYAVRDRHADGIVRELEHAADAGLIRLSVFESSTGGRLDADRLLEAVGDELKGAHVALCGPARLVAEMAASAGRAGAGTIETEDFDIRQGFGPDLSADIDRLLRPTRAFLPGSDDGARHPTQRQMTEPGIPPRVR